MSGEMCLKPSDSPIKNTGTADTCKKSERTFFAGGMPVRMEFTETAPPLTDLLREYFMELKREK